MAGATRYEKLKALLREKITSGKYERGDRFFSQNELMEKYNLSFSTVTRALDELVRDGYLTRHRGKGTFVNSTSTSGDNLLTEPFKVGIFAPWSQKTSPLSSGAAIYQHLEEARPENWHLKFLPCGTEPDDLEPYLFLREPVDVAVFLYPPDLQLPTIQKIAQSLPVVLLTESIQDSGLACITTSFASVAAVAFTHLLELGHSNIALVSQDEDSAYKAKLLEGYRIALGEGADGYHDAFSSTGQSKFIIAKSFSDVLDGNPERHISAIFALSCVDCLNVLSELKAMKVTVPESMSLLCFDNLGKATIAFPSVTHIAFPGKKLAVQLLHTIEAAVRGVSVGSVEIAPNIVVGESTGRYPSPGSMK